MKHPVVSALTGLVVLAVGFGSAQGGGGTTVKDKKGDSKPGYPDIAAVTAVFSASSVTWTIVAYAPFRTAKAPCVHVTSFKPLGATWSVCRGDPAKVAPPCIISVSLSAPYRPGGGCDGPAVVTRPNPSTIVYVVPRKTFTGLHPSPRAIAWQARVQEPPGCLSQPCDETAYFTSDL